MCRDDRCTASELDSNSQDHLWEDAPWGVLPEGATMPKSADWIRTMQPVQLTQEEINRIFVSQNVSANSMASHHICDASMNILSNELAVHATTCERDVSKMLHVHSACASCHVIYGVSKPVSGKYPRCFCM
jgi:hypothetical protein